MGESVLIIGGGLSGICLAHILHDEGISFELIDAGENHSSAIAAGMINPMVFRKMVKTWRGDDLIPFLKTFYTKVENKVDQQFFFPRKIRRAFSTPEEAIMWKERLEDKAYSEYICSSNETPPPRGYVNEKHGSGWVKSPGYVDAKLFMKSNLAFFSKLSVLTVKPFDFNAFDAEKLTYNGKEYKHVIFAEGYRLKENPFFCYLPLNQTKGEVLTITSNELNRKEILNRKCFILPTEDGKYKLGATFTWNTTDLSTTAQAKKELLEQYAALASAPITVEDQEAGIRPTVVDRRPLLGEHPTFKQLYVFNGMGTKGYMLAPYFAQQLIDYINGDGELDDEVNIQRFYKKHFQKS